MDCTVVDSGFFEAAAIPLTRGRNFAPSDRAGGSPVIIINGALAHLFWPREDPIGRIVRNLDGDEFQVVGVTQTTKVRTLGEGQRPFIYFPFSQSYRSYFSVVARSEVDPGRTNLDVVALVREMDRGIMVFEQKTMEEHLSDLRTPARISAFASALFAALATALAGMGLWGTVSHSVARRKREMAIRRTLGAGPVGVVLMLLREEMRVVWIGGLLGMGLSLACAQGLHGILFDTDPIDPVTFLVVPVAFSLLSFLAALSPARRAGDGDPAGILRGD